MNIARQAWATAARFAAYSFNKAHAASYALLAYFSAFTKTHHPLELACALFNHHQGLYPLRTLAAELARRGVPLRCPHVNISAYHSAPEEGGVRLGLDRIKGLSRRSAGILLEERTGRGGFASMQELLERVRLNSREITSLVLSGACDGLPPLSADDYPFPHEAALERLRDGCDPHDLALLPYPRPAAAAEDPRTRLYQALVRVRNELGYLEMHLCAHRLAPFHERKRPFIM